MSSFFIITMVVFIVSANIIGFITYRKKKNLYSAAFAIFYGMQLGYFLIVNSLIVFVIAIIVTLVRKYSS